MSLVLPVLIRYALTHDTHIHARVIIRNQQLLVCHHRNWVLAYIVVVFLVVAYVLDISDVSATCEPLVPQ